MTIKQYKSLYYIIITYYIAKVDVESSSLFSRSNFKNRCSSAVFLLSKLP